MTAETQRPYSWIRQVPGSLLKLDEKPLLGFPPPFNWEKMGALLKDALQLKGVAFSPGEWTWRSHDDLFAGLGNEVSGLPLAITPLPGNVFWVMPQQEIKKLLAAFLPLDSAGSPAEIDEKYLKTLYRFLAVEAINAFEKTVADNKLSPTIAGDGSLPTEDSLSIDVHFTLNGESFFGRLFLSKEFKSAWRQRYLTEHSVIPPNSPLADAVEVIVHLEAGRVKIKLSEWKKIKTGDFLFLDKCSLDPDEDKGRVMLTINGHLFFRARIKDGSIKILEHPLYHEADTVMEDTTNSHDDEDIFSDADLDLNSGEHTTGHGHSDAHSDDDFDLSDESLGLSKAPDKTTKETTMHGEGGTETHEAAQNLPSQPASIEDIELPVIIELGRIQIAIKKLMELQPGNMLDLNIHPEAGVDLIVNGKRIARGELLRIGETLGVRIQELS